MNIIPQLRDKPPVLGTLISKTLKSFAQVLEIKLLIKWSKWFL